MDSEIKVDTISEKTSANGVTIDGVSLKDSKIATANSVDSDAYVDGSIDAVHLSANSVDSDAYVDGSIDTAHIDALQVTGAKLNTDVISAQTELAAEPADTDEFMVSDAGVLKRIDYSLIKGGITEYDQWRITANAAQTSSGRTVLTANWERADTNFEVIGTGMSESSGIFTFPSTGKWLIQSNQMWSSNDGTTDYAHVYVFNEIQNTTDDSNYGRIARSCSSNSDDGAEYYQSGYVSTMIDITDVSNDKVCISAYRDAGVTWRGSSTAQDTGVSFMKLGDT